MRRERLHCKEKVSDTKQGKAKANLRSQQAATFVEARCPIPVHRAHLISSWKWISSTPTTDEQIAKSG